MGLFVYIFWVITIWSETIKSIKDDGDNGVDVVKMSKEYLLGADMFYSGKNKELFFKHLTDDFSWYVGSKLFETKQTFIESNTPYFGAVDKVFGHYEVISYGYESSLQSGYVILSISTYVEQKNCTDWFENIELFTIKNNKINQASAIFIDENEYTNKQIAINSPNCIIDKNKQDDNTNNNDENSNKKNEIIKLFSKYIDTSINPENDINDISHMLSDNYTSIGYKLWENDNRFDAIDIKDVNFKQYGSGYDYDVVSGYIFIYIEKGNNCNIIFKDFIALHFSVDKKIKRIIQFAVDAEPALQTFKDCIETSQDQHQEL